jgi:DMSO/TMAO reductase YedYZ molybdopterin-dependent catalytic subunit
VLGLVATPVLLGSLALGVAWTIGLVSFETFWGYSPLNLHIFLGLALLPLLVPHVLRRWERRATPGRLVDRRNALHLIAFSVGGMFAWRLLEWAAEARAEEGARRPSGSKHAGSFSGNDFPTTIWLFDAVPSLVDSSWRLELKGRLSEPGFISYDEMISLPTRSVRAVLDCTGGWWSEQIWQGVSVAEALLARGVHSSALGIVVVSVTGHRWSFSLRELPGLLLATHVGGEQLSPGHGYPVRLVAPGRRGFQWIKWVGSIEVV